MPIIYRIFNIDTQESYIGQTKQPIRQRLRDHIRKAIHRGRDNKLSQAIKECGTRIFEIEELYFTGIFDFGNEEELQNHLNEKEIEFIKKYNSIEEGYNTKKGGQGFIERRTLTPEEKAKKEAENILKRRIRHKKHYQDNRENILAARKDPENRAKQKARLEKRYSINSGKKEQDRLLHKEYMQKPENRAKQKARQQKRMSDPEYRKAKRDKERERRNELQRIRRAKKKQEALICQA